jgi:hypothetical protein
LGPVWGFAWGLLMTGPSSTDPLVPQLNYADRSDSFLEI